VAARARAVGDVGAQERREIVQRLVEQQPDEEREEVAQHRRRRARSASERPPAVAGAPGRDIFSREHDERERQRALQEARMMKRAEVPLAGRGHEHQQRSSVDDQQRLLGAQPRTHPAIVGAVKP